MVASHVNLFGTKPSTKCLSLLDRGDHPALDDTEFLDAKEMQQYQSMISALQWAVSIGHLNIPTTVMTLSSFCTMPCHGHMDHAKCMYGYRAKMKDAVICVCTSEPDYSALPEQEFDWERSVYGNVSEIIPLDAPTLLGKHVTLTHYYDANLYHDMLTGHSVTGILHLFNKTPIEWFSKNQVTNETTHLWFRVHHRLYVY
jgi:hypothetical protein